MKKQSAKKTRVYVASLVLVGSLVPIHKTVGVSRVVIRF